MLLTVMPPVFFFLYVMLGGLRFSRMPTCTCGAAGQAGRGRAGATLVQGATREGGRARGSRRERRCHSGSEEDGEQTGWECGWGNQGVRA